MDCTPRKPLLAQVVLEDEQLWLKLPRGGRYLLRDYVDLGEATIRWGNGVPWVRGEEDVRPLGANAYRHLSVFDHTNNCEFSLSDPTRAYSPDWVFSEVVNYYRIPGDEIDFLSELREANRLERSKRLPARLDLSIPSGL